MMAAIKAFGRRNLAYLAFVVLLYPMAMVLEATSKAQGPDRGGGFMLALLLWFLASLASVVVNIVLLIIGLSKNRPVLKEMIGIALPFAVVAVVLGLEGVVMKGF